MVNKLFDLNIEQVLENWEVEHALREVIANALDEQLLSETADIQITKDLNGTWHIRDFGRGLRIEHFTLNEDQEKLQTASGVIGKFGAGLKDALATFHRRGVGIVIRSSHGTYRLRQVRKHGFDDITTLHVEYDDTPSNMAGTDFLISGVADDAMTKAKSLFLRFVDEEELETTTYGQILLRRGGTSRIYILGVLAAEEPSFLFSYNITSLTDAMKKRPNRERLHVGRTTYAERVKAILRSATSTVVQNALAEQVTRRAAGDQADEMSWIEISQLALNLVQERSRVVMITEQELLSHTGILDSAQSDGYRVIVISDQQKAKLDSQMVDGGPQIRTIENYVREYNDSFQYRFVDPSGLNPPERRILAFTSAILSLVGMDKNDIPPIRISETTRVTGDETGGVWDPQLRAIVINRSRLASRNKYAATLLHEAGHARTGAVDCTRPFELVLTDYIGQLADGALGHSSTIGRLRAWIDRLTVRADAG